MVQKKFKVIEQSFIRGFGFNPGLLFKIINAIFNFINLHPSLVFYIFAL